LRGIASIVAEFIERLDLRDVTVVGNDTGGALVQLLACVPNSRIGRIALVSCDAFDNFPPGLTGKTLVLTGKLPPALLGVFIQQMRIRAMRRLPIAFGWLTLTKTGDAATARWMRPVLTRRDIRRDAVRVLRGIAADRRLLLEAADCLSSYARPALVVWVLAIVAPGSSPFSSCAVAASITPGRRRLIEQGRSVLPARRVAVR